MTTEKIYAQVLTALEALRTDGNSAVAFFDKCATRENLTPKAVENSACFGGDVGTVLYALKLGLEEDLRATQAKKNGKKNYSTVKRFMKSCENQSREFLRTAHKTSDGKFFCATAYCFYVSNSPDGLTFAPTEPDKIKEDAEKIYQNTIRAFITDGKTIEIPYTVAQLKAWKKQNPKKAFPLGEYFRHSRYMEGCDYLGINVDYLISAMEITGANTIQTNIEKGFLAMENSDGDRVGMMAIYTNSPEMPKI